jgi:uncharacterized repeat protein (TIGR01451 family)
MSVVLLALGAVAYAQEDVVLDVKTVVQKEQIFVNEEGETDTRLVPAETVTPGERVFYTITFTNTGNEPAENVVITNPIAAELTYVDGSAFGPGTTIEFSVDGGVSFGSAGELTVADTGGQRAASADDFTHIRWVMDGDLDTGSQVTARFAAILN